MIQYVITISTVFPKTHKRSSEPTKFIDLIKQGIKIHTIRGNYNLWEKRFKKIAEGLAFLSVRTWEGKPYKTKQIEVFKFFNTDGIGIEKLNFIEMAMTSKDCIIAVSKQGEKVFVPSISSIETLAKNDGLSPHDFKEWFKSYDLLKDMVIIHFSAFRYKSNEH